MGYAIRRSLSPVLLAQYQTRLPNKQMLAPKLHELYALNAPDGERPANAYDAPVDEHGEK